MFITLTTNQKSRRARLYLFGIKIFSWRLGRKSQQSQQKASQIDPLKTQRNHLIAIKNIHEKAVRGEKLIICFLVSNSSMFPARYLYETVKKDPLFSAHILILPDFRFGTYGVKERQQACYAEISQIYGEDVTNIDFENDHYDLNRHVDIVIPSLPGDVSGHKYSIENFHACGKLSILVNYGYFRSVYDRTVYASEIYSCYWRVFLENEKNLEECKRHSKVAGVNAVVTGYCKMDGYPRALPLIHSGRQQQKVIMICPHHSEEGGFNDKLSLSNFFRYADLFLQLPQNYPEITFIFRPHPMLFLYLQQRAKWSDKKISDYTERMKSFSNVIYSESGEYFSDFAMSDAIIQDCGSFLVEYFYTKKPCCYMLKNKKDIKDKFSAFGQDCLSHCYISYSKKEIIDFIETVVIAGIDPKKTQREIFAEASVMINHPDASEAAINEIKYGLSI